MDGIGARRDVSGVRGSDTSRSLSYAHAMAGSERDVSLKNQRGESIRATLCLPDVPAPAPAVLLCQGLSGVRNLVMPTCQGIGRRGYREPAIRLRQPR